MLDENISESKHLASLDFDISNIDKQMEEVERIVRETGISIKKLVENNFDISKILSQEHTQLKVELDKIEADIKASFNNPAVNTLDIKVNTEAAIEKIEKLQREYKEFQKEIQEGVNIRVNTPQSTPQQPQTNQPIVSNGKNAIFSKASGLLQAQAIIATERAAIETMETLRDVEYKVMEITRVMNDSTLDIKSFQNELFNLSVDYARSFDDVSEVALRYAQAGYSVSETISMTKDSLLALNTAELDVENSTQSMIGIMQQWGYTASELSTIIDKVNYTADNNAITSQDLVDGLLRSSSAAKNAKMSFDDTIGTLTAMKEASGRTGKEVGNALNSIISYVQRTKSLNVFEELGIQVYADETRKSFVPILDMLGDLSEKVKLGGDSVIDTLMQQTELTELYSQDLAIAADAENEYAQAIQAENEAQKAGLSDVERKGALELAGMHRRNYFIALLENFNKIQEVSNDLQNAEGYSLKENSRHMETLQAKTIQLVESLKRLAIQAGEAGLMDLAKGAVDAAIGVAGFIKGTGGLTNALLAVVAVMTIIKAQKMSQVITEIGGAFNKAWVSVKTFVVSLGTAATAEKAVATGASTMGVAIQGALGVIGLVTLAITGVVAVVSAYNAALEETKRKTLEQANAAYEYQSALDGLISEYEKLAKVKEKTPEIEEQIKSILEQINVLVKENSDIDSDKLETLKLQTCQYEKQLGTLKEISAQEYEANKYKFQEAYNIAKDKYDNPSNAKSWFEGDYSIGEAEKKVLSGKDIPNEVEIAMADLNGLAWGSAFSFTGNAQEQLEKITQTLEALDAGGITSGKLFSDLVAAQEHYSTIINENQKAIEKFNQGLIDQSVAEVMSLGATVNSSTALQEFNDIITDSVIKSGNYAGTTEDVAKQVAEITAKMFPEYSQSLDNVGNSIVNLAGITKSNSATMTNSNAVIDETQTKLKELADLYDLVSSGEEISTEWILDSIQKYPQYAAEIANVNTNKQAMIDITTKLAEIVKRENITKLQQDKEQILSNERLIVSNLAVAKSKLIVLRSAASFNEGAKAEFNQTEEQIFGLEKELSASVKSIQNIDSAISVIEKLDLSSYSAKKSTSSSKNTTAKDMGKDKEKEKEDAIKKQTDAINEQITSIEHLGSTGAYTLQEQIDLYKELLITSSKTTEIRQKLETNLHNLYKKQIEEKVKLAEKEKDEKIQAIKDSTDNEIKSLQKIKDERDSQRDEEDYNSERSELLEDISYWEQRTGQEAVTSLVDLKKRLAELDKNYQRKLEDEETQMQISDLEERRDREIRHIEDTWEELQDVFDSENLVMVEKSTLYASSLFTEYDMNFLQPFIDKIFLIKENMLQLASEAQQETERKEAAKKPPVKAYSVGTTKAARGWANLDENGEEIVFRKPIQGRYSYMEKGEAVLPHRISENIMDIGQYSLNQIMDKAEFVIAPALQARLASDLQRIQQNYTNSINNNYNNTSSDNRNSTDVNVKIENNNYIEDAADGQALANATARLILKSVKTLPYKR